MSPAKLLTASLDTQHKLGVAKLYVCVGTFVAGYHMLSHMAFQDGSLLLFVLLSVLFALGLLDAIVNDLLPAEFTAPAVMHTRYVSLIGLAGVNLCLMYPGLLVAERNVEMLLYGTNATAAVAIALIDLVGRHRQTHEKPEYRPDCLPTPPGT